MTYFPVKLGMDSYFLFFFFPISFSVVQLLGRKETLIHMILLFSSYLLVAVFVAYSYTNNLFALDISPEVMKKLRAFNIILSSFTALVFIILITIENQNQEKLIKKMLHEKDILMAEIFHRVKNNMNIVTSLLNLKKNSSDSEDVKDALEECRNRVFSMALVHEKIFKRKNIGGLNFGEYTKDLIIEMEKSFGESKTKEIHLHTTELELPLQYAIPCGLILNELVTNSYKHARVKGKELEIKIRLDEENGKRTIIFTDNGPGLQEKDLNKGDSLGLELVRSLSEQMNGEYEFENKNGMNFSLKF
jgi:two-component sensor histidine kinase